MCVFGAMNKFTFKFFLVSNENDFGVTCIRLSWSMKQNLLWLWQVIEHEHHEDP